MGAVGCRYLARELSKKAEHKITFRVWLVKCQAKIRLDQSRAHFAQTSFLKVF